MGVLDQFDPQVASSLPLAQLPPGMPPPAAAAPAPGAPVPPAPAFAPASSAPLNPQAALANAVAANKPILDTKSTSTTTAKLSKEQQQDLQNIEAIRGKEETAINDETKAKNAAANDELKIQNDAIAQAQAQQTARDQAIAQMQQRRQAAEAEYQRRLEDFNGQQFHSFWSGRGKASEVLADIGVALGAFASGGRGQNEAADILRNRIAEDFQTQKANIEMAKDRVVMAKTGIADADEARRILLADLDVKNAAALQAVQARLKAAQVTSPAMNNAQGAKAIADIDKDLQGLRQRATDQLTQKTTVEQKFTPGGAAGGSVADISRFIKEHPEDQPGAYALAEKLGYRGEKGVQLVDKLQNDFKGGPGGADLRAVVRDEEGNALGLAGTPRAVPQLQSDLRTIPRAIKQLQQLRDADFMDSTRYGPKFSNAVLAVAATTSAGVSVESQRHEAHTLTNMFGSPDKDAIDTKIAELQERLAATKNQLNPLPEGFVDRRDKSAQAAAAAKAGPQKTASAKPLSESDRAYLRTNVAKGGPEGALAQKILDAAGS